MSGESATRWREPPGANTSINGYGDLQPNESTLIMTERSEASNNEAKKPVRKSSDGGSAGSSRSHSAADSAEERATWAASREKLFAILHSNIFHLSVVALVIFDTVLVLFTLMLDLRFDAAPSHEGETALHVLHYVSLAVLCVFLVEVLVKFYVFRFEFFKHKLEVADAIVVLVSFVLDLVYSPVFNQLSYWELIIVFRLWRVARIVNGAVVASTSQLQTELEEEKHARNRLESELRHWTNRYEMLQREFDVYRQQHADNNDSQLQAPLPPSATKQQGWKIQSAPPPPPPQTQILPKRDEEPSPF